MIVGHTLQANIQLQCYIKTATPPHLLVLVERVDNQLHHSVNFSLEGMFFRLFSEFLNLCSIQPIQLDSLLLSEGRRMQTGENRGVHKSKSQVSNTKICAPLWGSQLKCEVKRQQYLLMTRVQETLQYSA